MPTKQRIYLRLRHRVQVKPDQQVTLKEVAKIVSNLEDDRPLERLVVHQVSPQDKHFIVLDVTHVVALVQTKWPELEIEIIGPSQAILEIVYPSKAPRFLLVLFVWLLLFIGSGLTIMNFHEDVSMHKVHQRLFEMVTGDKEEYPWLLQIPYSLGIGVGMILFFNHLFKKRLNEEPSPLELEMFNYQQSIDQYVILNENKEAQNKLDDHS